MFLLKFVIFFLIKKIKIAIEHQLKKLSEILERTYDQVIVTFQKQEKIEKNISQLSLQIKNLSEKLGNVEAKDKLEWWKVLYIFFFKTF